MNDRVNLKYENSRNNKSKFTRLNAAQGKLPSQGGSDASQVKSGVRPWMIVILAVFGTFLFFFLPFAIRQDFPGRWEAIVLSLATFGLAVIGIWREIYTSKILLNCKFCVYSRCNERGKDRVLFYCNRWAAKPLQFFGSIILTAYSVVVTLLCILSREIWIQVVTLLILVLCWGMALLAWISNLKFHYFTDPTPRAYLTPPNHPTTCICGGTGTCPKCGGTGVIIVGNVKTDCPIIVCPQEPNIIQPGVKYACLYICLLMLFGYIVGFLVIF
ncbi:MAG: zinc finger-like domain-containing protein [Candidatus Helarchaeota archaeon]|nr:zinc finger-like domain-containing protein [Candidatus Helarchaeota archaeon]